VKCNELTECWSQRKAHTRKPKPRIQAVSKPKFLRHLTGWGFLSVQHFLKWTICLKLGQSSPFTFSRIWSCSSNLSKQPGRFGCTLTKMLSQGDPSRLQESETEPSKRISLSNRTSNTADRRETVFRILWNLFLLLGSFKPAWCSGYMLTKNAGSTMLIA